MTDKVTKKEERLISALEKYPHPNQDHDSFTGLIFGILVSARSNGWTDEFIRICEDNPDVSFDEILDLIMTKERFPPLEIVDD